jgi:glutamate-1-semialdehyde aminotransferase
MPSWRPNADDLYDLGNGSYRWRDIYAGNATIQTSDKNLKQDIESISEAETRVAKVLKGMLRKYRLISSVEEKGDEARIHFGVIAQDVQKAFEDEGLDAFKYAMLCKTTYWETGVDEERVVYNTAEEAPSNATEKSVLAVRYSELLAFIIAGL